MQVLWFQSWILASLLQSNDPSEIILIFWFAAQKNIYYYVENSGVEFFQFLWWIESSEERHWSEIEIFCNITNVFIITFDKFKASLLNKSINFYNFSPPTKKKEKKIILTPSELLQKQKKIEQQEHHVAGDGLIENAIWFSASRRRCESGH